MPKQPEYRPPAMPLYVKRFLASKQVRAMTLEEVGAYTLLLCEQWDTADCMLPDDDQALANFSRLGERWAASKERIKKCFVTSNKNHGKIFNQFTFDLWNEQRKLWLQKRKAGILSGKSRRKVSNRPPNVFKQNGQHSGQSVGVLLEPSSSPSSSLSVCSEEQTKGARARAWPQDFILSVEREAYATGKKVNNVRVVWEQFEAHHRAKGSTFKNWDQAWRTWVMNEVGRFAKPTGPRSLGQPKVLARELLRS